VEQTQEDKKCGLALIHWLLLAALASAAAVPFAIRYANKIRYQQSKECIQDYWESLMNIFAIPDGMPFDI
jgi:hypothetical protein